MKTLPIAHLLDSSDTESGDHCIYVFRANDDILYVGKSEDKKGILVRVAKHLLLERYSAGNYLYVTVTNVHAVAVIAQLRQFLVGRTPRPEKTTLHVAVAGIPYVQEILAKNDIEWGDDDVGKHVLDNLPQSRGWQIDLYTFKDCCPNLLRYAKAYRIEPQPEVDMAEHAMIHYLKPRLNKRYY